MVWTPWSHGFLRTTERPEVRDEDPHQATRNADLDPLIGDQKKRRSGLLRQESPVASCLVGLRPDLVESDEVFEGAGEPSGALLPRLTDRAIALQERRFRLGEPFLRLEALGKGTPGGEGPAMMLRQLGAGEDATLLGELAEVVQRRRDRRALSPPRSKCSARRCAVAATRGCSSP